MNELLKSILDGIYMVVQNYGLAIVVFTILVRLVLMPLDYKSRVGMRKMSKLAPKQAALQKKYEKDPDKLQRKLAELYQKEKVSPMSSCWPMLVSMPILFAMFAAMRMMANEQLVQQAFDIIMKGETTLEPFLWIKNLWMPDSPFTAAWPNAQSLQLIESGEWVRMFGKLLPEEVALLSEKVGLALTEASFTGDALKETIAAVTNAMIAVPEYGTQTAQIPYMTINLLIAQWTVSAKWNGLFLLPIMSAASQYLMTVLNPAQQPQPTGNSQQAQQQASTGNFMKWFFPIFSLWLCSSYNAAFALYWVTSNLIAMAQNYAINKYLDHKEKIAAQTEDTAADLDSKFVK